MGNGAAAVDAPTRTVNVEHHELDGINGKRMLHSDDETEPNHVLFDEEDEDPFEEKERDDYESSGSGSGSGSAARSRIHL